MRRILITENQFKHITNEGINWDKSSNGAVNLSINQDMTDRANRGTNSVDTRVFGNKNDVLYGDNTGHWTSKSIADYKTSRPAAVQYYTNVMQYVINGRQGDPSAIQIPNGTDKSSITTAMKWFQEGKSDNYIIDKCKQYIEKYNLDSTMYSNTFNRINNEKNNRVARYTTGIVQGTDVKYVALFTMTDFNFSDAIKHGTIRQNGNTDNILDITKDQRQKGAKATTDAEIPVTYDNNVTPNIAQNFSLSGVTNGHFKQQYGLNGEGGYTSVAQFLDKSVNYARYALKNENFRPDFIVAPPSSSDFNTYYCTNLSNKLGVPFVKEFFKRNLINVRLDGGKTTDEMLKNGLSPKDVMKFENQIKNIAYKELSYFVSEPMRIFFKQYQSVFSNISIAPHSREKASTYDVFDCLMNYSYNTITKWIESGDIVEKHLVGNFQGKQNKLYQKKYNSTHIKKEIDSRINLNIGKKVFNQVLIKTYQIIQQYSEILKEHGYKLRFDTKRFKVTQLSKLYRSYIKNVYIVADEQMSNGQLLTRYQNAKFLIFDEDINTGTTLKLCIDALDEKLPMSNHNNLLCLVNAYSGSGY